MALHFHRIPIVLSARSLRKVVNFYKESEKSVEYRADSEDSEICSSTTALLQSSILRINEAKENLQNLYREILDEYKICEDNSEKREILTEIHQITEESELHASIAEANELITIFTAKLNESNTIQENMENHLEYSKTRAQKACAPAKDAPEIVQNMAENTEQNKNYVSPPSYSQEPYSNQHRGGPVAILEKEIAVKRHSKSRLRQKNDGSVIQSRAKHPNYRPNYGERCIFCHKGNHSSTRCSIVSDQSMRRKALKAQNRCWKCFSQTHNSFVCQKQDCAQCGQKHHVSLCFKKYGPHSNYANKLQPKHMPFNHSDRGDCQNCGQRSDRKQSKQSDRRKHASINAQICMNTSTNSNRRVKSSTSEQLVLMTAEGSVWNAGKQQYEKVLFVFDSGAQQTVIDEKLVEQFGLPKYMTEKCSISGIGGRIETFASHIVPFKIGTAFGEEIEMTVRTRPIITNGFPAVKLERDDVTFLKANDIFLASTKLRGEHQIPRVLVGLDYYHDLVVGNGARTPSGLHIAKTVFGHTIYGRGLSSVSQTKSVSYNLTAIREETGDQMVQENPELDGPTGSQRGKNPKYSDEIVHAYGFTTVPFPLKENVTDFEHKCSVAVRKLRSPHLHPPASNSSRRRPVLHVKPPPMPCSRRSPSTPASRRRPSRSRAVFRRRPVPQEVDHRRATTTRKKAKISDINSDNSCRSPEYHRQINDPCSIHVHRRYCTSCGGGGADLSHA